MERYQVKRTQSKHVAPLELILEEQKGLFLHRKMHVKRRKRQEKQKVATQTRMQAMMQ